MHSCLVFQTVVSCCSKAADAPTPSSSLRGEKKYKHLYNPRPVITQQRLWCFVLFFLSRRAAGRHLQSCLLRLCHLGSWRKVGKLWQIACTLNLAQICWVTKPQRNFRFSGCWWVTLGSNCNKHRELTVFGSAKSPLKSSTVSSIPKEMDQNVFITCLTNTTCDAIPSFPFLDISSFQSWEPSPCDVT